MTVAPSGREPRLASFTSPWTSVRGPVSSAARNGSGSAWTAKSASAMRGASPGSWSQPVTAKRGTTAASGRAASSRIGAGANQA